ncbi:unnamed protein product [Euphydryas editha]|uniref:Uncharacterized protein n=1 Tax=Euphydryas editha TaxID=104508 RepID=A0AAU9TVX0_EUPED|nr:unnamed protein product [Euphydryas editha]
MNVSAAFAKLLHRDLIITSSSFRAASQYSQPASTATTGILTTSMQRTRIPGHHPQPSQRLWHSTLHFGRSASRNALLSWSTQQPATTQHCTTPTHWGNTAKHFRLAVNYAASSSDSLEHTTGPASITRCMDDSTCYRPPVSEGE